MQRRKKIKGIQTGKEEVKLYLFSDDMILYMKIPRNITHTHTHTHTQMEQINDHIKVTGYKINT